MEIQVFEIGATVEIDGGVPAVVTAINLRGLEYRVLYEVTWWDERTRKSEWVEPYEIKPKDVKTKTLSFVPAA